MNLKTTLRRERCFTSWIIALAVVMAAFVPTAHGQPLQRDIVLVLDNSGSMRKNDPDFLTSVAVRAFIEGLDGDYHVAIVSFDQQAKVLRPLAALDAGHRASLLESLSSINYRGLLTNSPAAIESAIYELRTNGRAGAEKSIVFMTDGIVDVAPEGPDDGDVEKARWMKSTLADEAADRSVRIFGIAFTDNADFELIQTLAKRTGGEYYRAYTAADIDGVFSSIRSRLAGPGIASNATSAGSAGASPVTTPAPAVNRFLPEPSVAKPSDTPPAANSSALPEQAASDTAATLPGTAGAAVPDTGSSSSLPSLPVTSLPAGELPSVSLPVVSLGGDGAPVPDASSTTGSSTETTDAATTTESTSSSANETASDSGAGDSDAGDNKVKTGEETQTAPATSTASGGVSAPMDDSKFYLALMVGATAILLALAALIFVLVRRKPTTVGLADALMPKAFLNDLSGITEKPSYEVGAKPIVIGRLKGADTEAADYIVIDETTIGRRHSLIEYKEHSFWVTDQNSLNGTFVNNSRIETGVRLKHGDRIRFHKHEFEFLVLDMFETDRTMMSATEFADVSPADDDDDDATVVRVGEDDDDDPSSEDPTIQRM